MDDKVEELRQKLKFEYPGLDSCKDKFKMPKIKAKSVEPGIVRPTITNSQIASMIRHSSKYKQLREIDFGLLPKKLKMIRVRDKEIDTSLNGYLKNISSKTFDRNLTDRASGFKKAVETENKNLDIKEKEKKKFTQRVLNLKNLEVFGQVENKSKNPRFQENNLKAMERSIMKNVKSWCLKEMKHSDLESQLIDHWTFRHKRK
ncbi:hypothetical protein SteCoe_3814 [Stentor coeruleus]|uniref:Uncharacterized protein n=1 Tax=Stentor coeruleus TaxID=5963 RepID=A0A1R2CW62_9CILI|nr:hypothetical protein SteCoe_3814 [Stentor coeruleus]